MNKEILFRGKRIDTKEWVEGNYFIEERDVEDGYIWRDVHTIQQRYGDHFNYFEVDPATVGQYIVRIDKHGKKIFEGDVARDLHPYFVHKDYFDRGYPNEENYERYRENACTAIVQFVTEEVGSCGCCYPEFTGSGFIAYGIDLDCCEIIGNIHDNPELLEDTPCT